MKYTLEELQRFYGKPVDWVSGNAKPYRDRDIERFNEWQRAALEFVKESWRKQPTPLTIRQIHYHLVSRPELGYENNIKFYNKLVTHILRARITGLIPWDSISEQVSEVSHYEPVGVSDPEEALRRALETAEYQVGENPWHVLKRYLVVFTEKRELLPQLEYVTRKYYVRLVCFQGYGAWTRIYYEHHRMKHELHQGRDVYVLVVTDHDPSGLDINRLYGSIVKYYWKLPVEVHRVMLKIDQVQRYNLPPWAVKVKDPRAKWYIQNFGEDVWEVDALGRERMQAILEEEILKFIDMDVWQEVEKRNEERRKKVREMASKMLKG